MRQNATWIMAGTMRLAATAGTALAEAEGPYHNHKLVEIDVKSKAQFDALHAFGECLACRGGPGLQSFIVAPDKMGQLMEAGIDFVVREDNVQRLVDAQAADMQERRAAEQVLARSGADVFFGDYRTYDEINTRLDELIALNPSICTGFVVGTSLEGRDIRGVRIANLDPGDPVADEANKSGFFIQGGQHAREWVNPASVVYAADTLVRDYGSDPVITDLVDNIVFYIVPVVNPDGYIYTFPVAQGGQNARLWRKNRRDNGGSFGVDLNRNWGVDWGNIDGSSSSPNSDVYHGTGPFSEPETAAVSNYMLTLPNIVAHLDIHSFSQLILGPWAYSETICPPREAELRTVQEAMESAMTNEFGVAYNAGLGCDALLYSASGVAPDWSFGVLNALAWTYELRDTGTFGFELPANQILPTAQETFEGILVLADYIQVQLVVASSDVPSVVPAGTAETFDVAVTPFNGAGYQPGSAMLHWRIGASGPFTIEPLTGADPQSLVATLPATACGNNLEFFVSAQTTNGATIYDPEDGANAPYVVPVEEITVVADDDVETGAGWSVGDASDTATTGVWALADPQGTAAQPEDDHSEPGANCWVTDGAAGPSLGSFDVDGGATTLFSPTFDLSAAGDAQVSYWRWYSNSAGAGPNEDIFRVDVSNDGGANWFNVETVGPTGAGTSGGWIQHSFSLTSIVPTSTQVQLRFVAEDAGAGSIVEAAIDDLKVLVIEACTTCPGDVNGDNAVDLADLNLVLFNFGGPGPAGDVNGSGAVDLADLNLVLFNFGNGC